MTIIVPSPGENLDSVNASSKENSGATVQTSKSTTSSSSSPSPSTTSAKKKADTPKSLALPNELNEFASYNYIWTLYCLTEGEVNDPENTYRKDPPAIPVLKSGGGLGSKKIMIAGESEDRYEFFIDNVEIEQEIAPNIKRKQSNMHRLTFDVYEPYSMGTFLQALQIAAETANQGNYRTAPFLLTLDFVGWDISGKFLKKPNLRRMFPIEFNKIDAKVTESGTHYSIEADPWTEQNFNSVIMDTKADIKLEGSTLLELCQKGIYSIATHFNNRQVAKKNNGDVITPDQYVIMFPKEDGLERISSATILGATGGGGATLDLEKLWQTGRGTNKGSIDPDFAGEAEKVVGLKNIVGNPGLAVKSFAEDESKVNEIGLAKITDSFISGKKQPFGKPKFTERDDEPGLFERGKLQIRKNSTVISFKSGTSILEMMEELILLSDYGKKIADAAPDNNGMIPYFKIETHCYQVNDKAQLSKGGRNPLIYVFLVVPYRAHVSKYGPVSEAYPGYDNILAQACKEYNYLYTGKNLDIIDFDLSFSSGFYTAYQGAGGKGTASSRTRKSDEMYKQDPPTEISTEAGSGASSTVGAKTLEENIGTSTGGLAGTGGEHDKISIARAINDALLNSKNDLALLDLTIWGDPYYIADSGFGNYSAAKNPISINLTKDGTMDYQREEVDVLVTFRTPLDINKQGWQDFSASEVVPSYSGLYCVNSCVSRFKDGLFTQVINMRRRNNQLQYDLDQTATSGSQAARTQTTSAGGEGKTAMAEKEGVAAAQEGVAADLVGGGRGRINRT